MKPNKKGLLLTGLMLMGLSSVYAQTSGTMTTMGDWNTSTNWQGGVIPDGAGNIAYIGANAGGPSLTAGMITIGKMVFLAEGSGNDRSILGGSGTFRFATSDNTTPMVDLSAITRAKVVTTYGIISGTQGLAIDAGITGVRVSNATNWSNFSGTLTLMRGGIAPQSGNNNTPINSEFVLGTGNNTATISVTLGRTVDFASIAGNASSIVTGGGSTNFNLSGTVKNITVSGTSYTALANTERRDFQGSIIAAGAGVSNYINVNKNGAYTQIFSGTNYYAGNTSVNAGTLLVNGFHNVTNGAGAADGAAGVGGKYMVANGATLGGNGTIKPFDTSASGVNNMIAMGNGSHLSPGDSGAGFLTLDGANVKAGSKLLLGGATLNLDLSLSANGQGTYLNFINAKDGSIDFGNGSVIGLTINITDLTNGGLSGDYLLFQSDNANAFNMYGGSWNDIISLTGLNNYSSNEYSIQVSSDFTKIYLNVIPEPSTWMLLIGGVLLSTSARVMRRRV